ncbi:MAG: TonB-dependent receptor plug domain-containing protein [Colwellia sp.]|nr:TonB-dependent receptor plug domain-containing protein [Colwellia sp.]
MHWRKKIAHSSLMFVSEKLTVKAFEQAKFNSASIVAMLSIACVPCVQSAELTETIPFNIPKQRADLSLTQFAEQADLTLIFSFDKVSDTTANKLSGNYSVEQAIDLLLENTDLVATMSDQGLLSINKKDGLGKADDKFKKNTLSSSTNTVLDPSVSTQTNTDDTKVAEKEIEVIEVKGIRGALGRALDTKRQASGVVDSISSEDFGKFPDTNLAESLQRITGVSIDRSGGEGQKITVRGFGPQFNTVLVNGRQQASEDPGRDFSFDTIAAEMVRSLDVHKTSSASLQSGGIGSTINVKTAKPFALSGFKLAGSVKDTYDDNSEETSPHASLLVSNTFNDDTVGALFAISYLERETRLNRAQSRGWRENSSFTRGTPMTISGDVYQGDVFIPQNFDSLVTTENRERTNANLVLQYAPNDSLIITADALYSDFDVRSDTTSYGHWFTSDNVEDVVVDDNGTVTEMYQQVGLATDFHAKKADRLTDSLSIGLNFSWDVNDNLNMKFDLSNSNAKREANNGRGGSIALLGYANRVQWNLDDNILPYYTDFAAPNPSIYSGQQKQNEALEAGDPDKISFDPDSPIYQAPQGVSNYLDTSNSGAHVMIRRGREIEDDVTQFKWDSIWLADGDSVFSAARFGIAY